MSLPRVLCTNCNTYTFSFATVPYCNTCISKHCAMKNHPDCYGLYRCNNIADYIIRNDSKYCIGHYKFMQKFCKRCGDPKALGGKLSYDDYYYCSIHKPRIENRNICVHLCLKNNLPRELICSIIKLC